MPAARSRVRNCEHLMRRDLLRVALTRKKTLTEEAKAGLERVGSKVFAWSKRRNSFGARLSSGASSREEWMLWASAHTDALTRSHLIICKLPCLKYVIIRNNRNNT